MKKLLLLSLLPIAALPLFAVVSCHSKENGEKTDKAKALNYFAREKSKFSGIEPKSILGKTDDKTLDQISNEITSVRLDFVKKSPELAKLTDDFFYRTHEIEGKNNEDVFISDLNDENYQNYFDLSKISNLLVDYPEYSFVTVLNKDYSLVEDKMVLEIGISSSVDASVFYVGTIRVTGFMPDPLSSHIEDHNISGDVISFEKTGLENKENLEKLIEKLKKREEIVRDYYKNAPTWAVSKNLEKMYNLLNLDSKNVLIDFKTISFLLTNRLESGKAKLRISALTKNRFLELIKIRKNLEILLYFLENGGITDDNRLNSNFQVPKFELLFLLQNSINDSINSDSDEFWGSITKPEDRRIVFDKFKEANELANQELIRHYSEEFAFKQVLAKDISLELVDKKKVPQNHEKEKEYNNSSLKDKLKLFNLVSAKKANINLENFIEDVHYNFIEKFFSFKMRYLPVYVENGDRLILLLMIHPEALGLPTIYLVN